MIILPIMAVTVYNIIWYLEKTSDGYLDGRYRYKVSQTN